MTRPTLVVLPGGKPVDEPYDHNETAYSDLAQLLWRSQWVALGAWAVERCTRPFTNEAHR
jgi:hypothetical protein